MDYRSDLAHLHPRNPWTSNSIGMKRSLRTPSLLIDEKGIVGKGREPGVPGSRVCRTGQSGEQKTGSPRYSISSYSRP